MLGKQHSEVLVVGAGPTGLYAALRLAERGVRVAVVDKHWRSGVHGYALALHPRSLRLLAPAGISQVLLERGHRVGRVALWVDGSPGGVLDYAELGGDYPFALVLPQSILEGELEQRLRERQVEVHWNHRVESLETGGAEIAAEITQLDQVASGYPVARMEWAAVDHTKARSQFVVAADGYHSSLRERLGIRYEQYGPVETFSVYEFDAAKEPGHEMRLVLDGETSNVFWPLAGGRCRWSFQIAKPSQHEPTRERLNDLIKARAPWFPPVSGEIHWTSTVQFDRRLASGMGRDRVWLAGDSAHLSSPLGVQSMNTGLVDAHELSAALASILRENAGTEALERYAEERLGELGPLFGEASGLRAASHAQDWARRLADRILRAVPATAGDLSRMLSQMGLEYDAPAETRV